MTFINYLLLWATPFYQRWWFWVLLFIAVVFILIYGLRWWASRKYRKIMASRQKANARINVLLREMRER